MKRIYQKLIKDLIPGEKFIYNNVLYDVEDSLMESDNNLYCIKFVRCNRDCWFYLSGNVKVDYFKGEI